MWIWSCKLYDLLLLLFFQMTDISLSWFIDILLPLNVVHVLICVVYILLLWTEDNVMFPGWYSTWCHSESCHGSYSPHAQICLLVCVCVFVCICLHALFQTSDYAKWRAVFSNYRINLNTKKNKIRINLAFLMDLILIYGSISPLTFFCEAVYY